MLSTDVPDVDTIVDWLDCFAGNSEIIVNPNQAFYCSTQ